jgi:hypothetical protein
MRHIGRFRKIRFTRKWPRNTTRTHCLTPVSPQTRACPHILISTHLFGCPSTPNPAVLMVIVGRRGTLQPSVPSTQCLHPVSINHDSQPVSIKCPLRIYAIHNNQSSVEQWYCVPKPAPTCFQSRAKPRRRHKAVLQLWQDKHTTLAARSQHTTHPLQCMWALSTAAAPSAPTGPH